VVRGCVDIVNTEVLSLKWKSKPEVLSLVSNIFSILANFVVVSWVLMFFYVVLGFWMPFMHSE